MEQPLVPRLPKPRPVGRPVQGKEAKTRYQVMLEPHVADKLRRAGSGNLSQGIAMAAERL